MVPLGRTTERVALTALVHQYTVSLSHGSDELMVLEDILVDSAQEDRDCMILIYDY